MRSGYSRRRMLQSLAGGPLVLPTVLGWSPSTRSWVTEVRGDVRADGGCDFTELPPLDGTLHLDPATRAQFADDFGHLVSRQPCAVLTPGSVRDIVEIVRFAGTHGIKVAMNGQSGTPDLRESHSNFGQAQVEAGVVVDAKPLDRIFEIEPDGAEVEAGVLWSQLFDAAAPLGLTPPVLTDYMHLSVGGTLSLGGMGGSTSRFGAQVDNVIALRLMLGDSDRINCSRRRRPDLFNAALSGLGQCAMILRARVRLIPAPAQARVYNLFYDDLNLYLEDQLTLLASQRFSYLEGQIVRNASDTGWRFQIEAAQYFTPPQVPDDNTLLAGLRDQRAEAQIDNRSYRDWAFRIDPVVGFIKSIGRWATPHPWLSLFIPASQAATFIGALVADLQPDDLGVLVPGVLGPALLYPFDTRRTQQPLFRTPSEPAAFHLSLLRFPGADPAQTAGMLADNRALYDQVVALGGTRYPIGAIPDFTPADWQAHFGPVWETFAAAKRRLDPANIFTPGQGIFL
jgi:cytokinin dehydrogenase